LDIVDWSFLNPELGCSVGISFKVHIKMLVLLVSLNCMVPRNLKGQIYGSLEPLIQFIFCHQKNITSYLRHVSPRLRNNAINQIKMYWL